MFADAFGVLSGNMSTVIGAAGGAEVDSNNIFSSCRGRKFALQVDNHQRFAQKFCSSADNFVGRLILKDELKSHTGCVNTINWNSSGSLAVSGSDDTTVCLWDYPALTLKKSVRTLHTANIFCAKFFPEKDELVASCGADSKLLVTDVARETCIRNFQGHESAVKRFFIDPLSPSSVIISCSADGTVRQCDLREKPCSVPAATRRPPVPWGRLGYSRLEAPSEEQANPNVLVVFGREGDSTRITSISVPKLRPEYFAIGGGSSSIWLLDRRMLQPHKRLHFKDHPSVPVAKFRPQAADCSRLVTGVSVSFDGSKIIGSWSQGIIGMFDVHTVCVPIIFEFYSYGITAG
eukprot:Lankesteria_metandrocarpae@DN5193_c1_g1_i4.p1